MKIYLTKSNFQQDFSIKVGPSNIFNTNLNIFTIVRQNLRSIGNSIEQIEEILTTRKDIQILCISEYSKSNEEFNCYSINYFTLNSKYCEGVVIYCRKGIVAVERKNIGTFSLKGQLECT